MHLDLLTMAAVNITVTTVLAAVLLSTWMRERSALVGGWGLALCVIAIGALVATVSVYSAKLEFAKFGPALMILGTALQWNAAREFEHRRAMPVLILLGPLLFLLIALFGGLQFDMRLMVACSLLAIYNFAAGGELAVGTADRLGSRWWVVSLLVVTGSGYLSWLPLAVTMPIKEVSLTLTSHWFGIVILITLAGRVALAFLVLALEKERREFEQRVDAMTDPLTGLPNRRALVEAAHALSRPGAVPNDDPISVLLFDLDHFKEINDAYGHRLGDHVLKVFAETLTKEIEGESFVARMGGEEFAAILPGANRAKAARAAEQVRSAFESSAALVEGVAVKGTVSVGACSDNECGDLGTLFHRADTALYRAKNAGRNRVVLVEAEGSPQEREVAPDAPFPGSEHPGYEYGHRLTA